MAYEEDVLEEKTGTATVFARQGGTVNLRSSPSLQAIVRIRVPLGEKVEVLEETNEEWARVQYGRYTGYMMREFLAPD